MKVYQVGKNLCQNCKINDIFETPNDEMVEELASLPLDAHQVIFMVNKHNMKGLRVHSKHRQTLQQVTNKDDLWGH